MTHTYNYYTLADGETAEGHRAPQLPGHGQPDKGSIKVSVYSVTPQARVGGGEVRS